MRNAIFILTFLLMLWGLGFAAFVASSLMQKAPESLPKAQAIVILTGGEKRIEMGLDLFKRGAAPEVLISGVHPDASQPMIFEENRVNLAELPCCVTLGRSARSTKENANETQKWLADKNVRKIILVTSDYHMHRARMEFAFEIPWLRVIPYPVPEPHYTLDRPVTWFLLFREYHKFLWRWAQLTAAHSFSDIKGN